MSIIIKGGSSSDLASVKPASTTPLATDPALVVSLSPNSAASSISGTVTANQGTPNSIGNSWPVEVTDGTNILGTAAHPLRVDPTGTTTQPISAASLPLPTGAAQDATVSALQVSQGSTTSGEKGTLIQGAVTTAAPTYTTAQTSPLSLTTAGALRTDASATTQPISGTVTATQATGTNLHTVVDSGTVTANIGTTNGLALDATVSGLQVSQGSTTSGEKGSLIQGAVTTASPAYTTAQTSPLSLTTAGALRTDASATTQPVSGTVTVTQATGTNLHTVLDSGTLTSITNPVTVAQATPANLQATVTQQTITKGTQGATGVTTQDLKDAGRNVSTLFMVLPVVTTATDTLQSLTGYKSGAAVGATTTPAVVTAAKTLRLTSAVLTYVGIATAGSAKFSLRANTGGVVAIGSPLVANWVLGTDGATAGFSSSLNVLFPDGLEFAAGTGIGISVVGLSTTQTLAATGFAQITIYGFEY